MNCTKYLGLAAVAALVSACDGVIFEPAGNWSFERSTVIGRSTYLNPEHDVEVEYDFEEMFDSATPVIMVSFSYDPAASELILSGVPYPVVDRVATLEDNSVLLPGGLYECDVVQTEHRDIAFNADGSEALLRQTEGFRFTDTSNDPTNNCSAVLTVLRTMLLGGTVPPALEVPLNLGLIKAYVVDQLRSFEYTANMVGENLSASPSVDGAVQLSFQAEDRRAELAAKVAAIRAALGL